MNPADPSKANPRRTTLPVILRANTWPRRRLDPASTRHGETVIASMSRIKATCVGLCSVPVGLPCDLTSDSVAYAAARFSRNKG